MKRTRRAVLAASLALLACAGCGGGVPLAVARPFYDAINRPFRNYVANDGTLDADQKARRVQALDSFDAALKKAEG